MITVENRWDEKVDPRSRMALSYRGIISLTGSRDRFTTPTMIRNQFWKKSEPTLKRTKSPGPVRRDTKEVLTELVGKLTGKQPWIAGVVSENGKKDRRGNALAPI